MDIANGLLKQFGATANSAVDRVVTLLPVGSSPGPGSPEAGKPAEEKKDPNQERICGRAVVDGLVPEQRDTSALTLVRTFRIEPGGGCPPGTETATADASRLVCNISGTNTVGTLLQAPGEISRQLARFTLSLQIRNANRAAKRPPPADQGLVYRLPGSAVVSACLVNCDGATSSRVLAEQLVSVPQFGIEASMPVERRLFSNRSTRFEFGPAGEIISIRFLDALSETKKQKSATDPTERPRPDPESRP